MQRASLEEFLDWVKTQFGQPYQYEDYCNCPMANFAREKRGFQGRAEAGAYAVYGDHGNYLSFYATESRYDKEYCIFNLIKCSKSFEELAQKIEITIDGYKTGMIQ